MTATKQYSSERLATVLLAPVVSEKGTFIAEKHEQVARWAEERAGDGQCHPLRPPI